MAGMAPGLPDGYTLIALDEIDSTNAEALRRVRDGAGAGTVIHAQTQTQGRGRKGSAWISPQGNLYASVIVEPPADRPPGQLAFVTAVAAAEAVCEMAPASGSLQLKWPNDLLLDGRKLGGILIEGGSVGHYVIGLGINLSTAPSRDGITATTLGTHTGVEVGPEVLLTAFCRRFAAWDSQWRRDGFAPVRAAWRQRASGMGQLIDARLPNETLRGVFVDIDADGALLLDLPDGSRKHVTAGAIYFADAGTASCC